MPAIITQHSGGKVHGGRLEPQQRVRSVATNPTLSSAKDRTMTTIFTPTDNELAAARKVVLAADPSESAWSDGVAIVTEGGERRWVAWSPQLLAATTPVPTTAGDGVVIIPRRLVEFGANVADDLDDIELSV